MKTIEIQLYKFNELTEKAKQTAINNWRNNGIEDVFQSERIDSYKKAKEIFKQLGNIEGEIFGSRLIAYIENNFSHLWTENNRISKHVNGKFNNCYYSYKSDCQSFKISKIFKTNNLENCPLTGVYYDYVFLAPIIDFYSNPSKKTSNLNLCASFPDYDAIVERDMDYLTSNEACY